MSRNQSARRPSTPLAQDALSRMQGAVAQQHGGGVPKGSYIGDLQRHLAKAAREKGARK